MLQLAAICNNTEFNLYITPGRHIDKRATAVNGLTFENDTLRYHGQKVDVVPIEQALQEFGTYLSTIGQPILVGHNIQRFDCLVLMRKLMKYNLLEQYSDTVVGCLDTLRLARRLISHEEVENFKQATLVKTFLQGVEYQAHNALSDCRVLSLLYAQVLDTTEDILQRYLFHFTEDLLKQKF